MISSITASIEQYKNLDLHLDRHPLIFLYGEVGAGKTSFVKSQLEKYGTYDVTSPTYTYYQKYGDFYHFDLYRIQSYEQFVAIGGEEILDNRKAAIFVEWPQILEPFFSPDIIVKISAGEQENTRKIHLIYKK